ncbi:uncharacterized protein FIESC28_09776 [Fusarium coffeatum]|uniref:Uncharacterized protein n=1 Tax=Fusarium coffeatum TaxID=231269 RepID=A0A366QZT4_9HYPO|nr:uncharacterized protein FIESC28_09776 [Fusarium coffeatum]RBR09606.1 hypothetical protein FIESC28_09776 [Fusarium coffeatum]
MHQVHYLVQDAGSWSRCITSLDDDNGTAADGGSNGAGDRGKPPVTAERYPSPSAHGRSPKSME